ncbi:PREDICTED: uncharacterized protein LOC109237902 [Nicotiana attenuata]|uniref:SnoaL-like domain-containing protein n=1 Tax=Nicotiana attenuata TaxID=49451 RepID=A0A314LD65_NICAT|nr:PREDICTED: uncharacterized protein LOC109237902 [Nicotiana attenuata]OIT39588.1 hypothetical protein A4A49_29060 [Nicotiana attenuata]
MFLKMGSMTFPFTFSNKKFPTIFQETNSQYSLQPKKKFYPHFIQLHNQKYVSSFINLNQFYSLSYVSKGKSLLYPVKCNSKDNSETPEEGQKAVETVQKLYNALRNKNLNELSDIIGEECRCISNVASSLQTFYGKEQVIDFFNSIIKLLGNNFEFVIQPTIHDGTSVGVAWELACNETHVPIGKGFGFYVCHYYKGKMMIRNVEMFMDPLLRIEPVRLKVSSFLLRAIQKMNPPDLFKGKKKQAMSILFIILLFAAILYLVKNSRNLM